MASPAPSGCVSSIPKCPLLVSPCAASGGREKNLAGAGGQRSWRWVHKSRSPKRAPSAKSGQGHHALSRRQVPRERLGRDCRGGTGGWLHYVGKHQALPVFSGRSASICCCLSSLEFRKSEAPLTFRVFLAACKKPKFGVLSVVLSFFFFFVCRAQSCLRLVSNRGRAGGAEERRPGTPSRE